MIIILFQLFRQIEIFHPWRNLKLVRKKLSEVFKMHGTEGQFYSLLRFVKATKYSDFDRHNDFLQQGFG